MAQCQFGPSGYMYLGINSKATALSTNFDKVHIYKYLHNTAKFNNAKMLSAPGQMVVLMNMVVTLPGDTFYSGKIKSSTLSVNAGEVESFVLRLNTNMDYVFLRTFQGGTTDASALAIMAESTPGIQGVYVHIKEIQTIGKYAMRLVKLQYGGTGSNAGMPLWSYKIYEPTNLAVPFGMGGLTKDSTYVYSCMVIGNSAGSLTQTIVTKFDIASGAL